MSEQREKFCNTPWERQSVQDCSAVIDTAEELVSKTPIALDAAASGYIVENSFSEKNPLDNSGFSNEIQD